MVGFITGEIVFNVFLCFLYISRGFALQCNPLNAASRQSNMLFFTSNTLSAEREMQSSIAKSWLLFYEKQRESWGGFPNTSIPLEQTPLF